MYKLKDKKILVITLMLILAMGLNGCAKNTEGLVAEVNGEGITQENYDTELQVQSSLYERQFGEGSLAEVGPDGRTIEEGFKEDILDKLVLESIIIQEAEKDDITVSNEEVEERIDKIRTSVGGEENFQEFLKANEIPFDFFKESTRKEYLIEKYKEKYIDETNIGEEEAEKFFDENKENLVIIRASHILVNNEEDGKVILEKLNNGEDFASLAVTESLDSTSGVRGGDLGYFTKGSLAIKEFEDAAFALKVGEISGLVKTEVGYHIIYLQDRKDTFKELKNEIIMLLKEDDYTKHIQELKNGAKIKTFLQINNKEK